jgi:hypothetical protein
MTKQSWVFKYVGVIEWVGALMALAAWLLTSFSSLPGGFAFERAFHNLSAVLLFPYLPATVAFVALMMQRREIWDFIQQSKAQEGQEGLQKKALLQFFFAVALPVGIIAGLMAASTPLADRIALLVIGSLIYWAYKRRELRVGRVVEIIEPFLLFVLMSYSYSTIKAAIGLRSGPLWDAELYAIDRLLFFGNDPLATLKAWLPLATHAWVYAWLDWAYYTWFFHFIVVFALLTAKGDREELRSYVASILLTYHIGGLAYHLFPALGPVYHFPRQTSHLTRIRLHTNRYQGVLWQNLDAIRKGVAKRIYPFEYIACMPSLHVASEFVMLFFSRRSRPLQVITLPFFCAVLMATVVLGWHYVIDWLGGLVVAGVAIWISLKVPRTAYAPWAILAEDAEEEGAEEKRNVAA